MFWYSANLLTKTFTKRESIGTDFVERTKADLKKMQLHGIEDSAGWEQHFEDVNGLAMICQVMLLEEGISCLPWAPGEPKNFQNLVPPSLTHIYVLPGEDGKPAKIVT